MTDHSTPPPAAGANGTELLDQHRVSFWDRGWNLSHSGEGITGEFRDNRTTVRFAVPATDELAQAVLEDSFGVSPDDSGFAKYVAIDRDGGRWSGWLSQVNVTKAAGVRVVELHYVDVNHKSEFAKLLEAL